MADSLNKHFLARKLHSLTGLVPVGAFLIFHLWSNSMSRHGAKAYNEMVQSIHKLNYLLLIEIFVIILPLLFHAAYGLVIWWQSQNLLKGNVDRYGYTRNWLYLLQRLTGGITLLFIAFHLYSTRFQTYLNEALVSDLYNHMQMQLANPLVFAFYILGTVSAAFHLANGLRLMGITWGLTIGDRSQRYALYFAGFVFVGLSALGVQSLLGFNAL